MRPRPGALPQARDRAPAAVRLGLRQVDRAGRAQQHAAAADLRARVLRRQDGQERAPVHERPRSLRGAAERVEADRRGARARYTNYQLSAEYRTYDVTGAPPRANTLGVELGNGTAKQHQDGQPGRRATNSFAWWTSTAVGQRDAHRPGGGRRHERQRLERRELLPRRAINIDTGDGGDRLESRTITAIGTAPASTTLAVPAAARRHERQAQQRHRHGRRRQAEHRFGDQDDHRGRHGGGQPTRCRHAPHDRRRGAAPAPPLQGASWLWNVAGHSTSTPAGTIYVRKTFTAADPAALAARSLRSTPMTRTSPTSTAARWRSPGRQQRLADVPDRRRQARLVAGANVIAVAATNAGGAGGLIGAPSSTTSGS